MSPIRGLEWPLAAALAASIILAVPLWCVTAPAMPDYPAHLASFALIGGAPSHYYSVNWDFLPNLASEILVPLLARLMPLELAARLFLSVTVALWAIGPALIQRALFGRVNAAALFAAFFAYNANFMWGFFNYTFATGLAFLVFAAWIATDGKRAAPRLVGFAFAFTAIYFSHLFALAVLILAIGCFELSGWLSERPRKARALAARAWPVILVSLPAAFAFLVLKPAAADRAGVVFNLLDTMVDRAGAALQFGFDNPVYVLTGALCLTFFIGLATRTAVVHPRMRLVLVVFTAAAIFAPEWALSGWGVHMRLPAVLGALAFAAIDWRVTARTQRIAATILLLTLAASATVVTGNWRDYDAQYSEFRAHIADIKQGGRILIVLDGDSIGWDSDQPYWHIAEFAIAPRGVFTPLMFTTAGQHVIHIQAPLNRIAASSAQQGSPPDIDELDDLAAGRLDLDEDIRDIFPYLMFFQCHFDQAVVIHGAGRHARVPDMLRAPKEGTFYTLYDIVPDKRCAGR